MSKINWKQVGFDFARIQLFGWSVLDIVQKAERGQALTPAENKILQGFTERAKDLEVASIDRQLKYHTRAIKSLLSQRTKCLPGTVTLIK